MTHTFTYPLSLLIKIGQEKHIDQLQQRGLIHCKTVKYFRELEIEDIELRQDNQEGAQSSVKLKDLKLYVDNMEIPFKLQKGRFNSFDPNLDLTNIYCLCAVTPDMATGKSFIDQRVTKFGNSALLITDPGEFIRRVAIETKGKYKCTYAPVQYYPDSGDYTRLTVFNKPNSFEFQREFRFHFDHTDNSALEFEIGSIEDISLKIESERLPRLTLGIEESQAE